MAAVGSSITPYISVDDDKIDTVCPNKVFELTKIGPDENNNITINYTVTPKHGNNAMFGVFLLHLLDILHDLDVRPALVKFITSLYGKGSSNSIVKRELVSVVRAGRGIHPNSPYNVKVNGTDVEIDRSARNSVDLFSAYNMGNPNTLSGNSNTFIYDAQYPLQTIQASGESRAEGQPVQADQILINDIINSQFNVVVDSGLNIDNVNLTQKNVLRDHLDSSSTKSGEVMFPSVNRTGNITYVMPFLVYFDTSDNVRNVDIHITASFENNKVVHTSFVLSYDIETETVDRQYTPRYDFTMPASGVSITDILLYIKTRIDGQGRTLLSQIFDRRKQDEQVKSFAVLDKISEAATFIIDNGVVKPKKYIIDDIEHHKQLIKAFILSFKTIQDIVNVYDAYAISQTQPETSKGVIVQTVDNHLKDFINVLCIQVACLTLLGRKTFNFINKTRIDPKVIVEQHNNILDRYRAIKFEDHKGIICSSFNNWKFDSGTGLINATRRLIRRRRNNDGHFDIISKKGKEQNINFLIQLHDVIYTLHAIHIQTSIKSTTDDTSLQTHIATLQKLNTSIYTLDEIIKLYNDNFTPDTPYKPGFTSEHIKKPTVGTFDEKTDIYTAELTLSIQQLIKHTNLNDIEQSTLHNLILDRNATVEQFKNVVKRTCEQQSITGGRRLGFTSTAAAAVAAQPGSQLDRIGGVKRGREERRGIDPDSVIEHDDPNENPTPPSDKVTHVKRPRGLEHDDVTTDIATGKHVDPSKYEHRYYNSKFIINLTEIITNTDLTTQNINENILNLFCYSDIHGNIQYRNETPEYGDIVYYDPNADIITQVLVNKNHHSNPNQETDTTKLLIKLVHHMYYMIQFQELINKRSDDSGEHDSIENQLLNLDILLSHILTPKSIIYGTDIGDTTGVSSGAGDDESGDLDIGAAAASGAGGDADGYHYPFIKALRFGGAKKYNKKHKKTLKNLKKRKISKRMRTIKKRKGNIQHKKNKQQKNSSHKS